MKKKSFQIKVCQFLSQIIKNIRLSLYSDLQKIEFRADNNFMHRRLHLGNKYLQKQPVTREFTALYCVSILAYQPALHVLHCSVHQEVCIHVQENKLHNESQSSRSHCI